MAYAKKNMRALVKKAQIFSKISRARKPKKLSKEIKKRLETPTGYGRLR